MKPLDLLFTSIRIGNMKVNNRIILSPMETRLADHSGHITNDSLSYYRERAKGGAGYITVGNACVHPSGKATERMICIYDDTYMAGIRKLAQAIHAVGGKVVVQLNHAGRQTSHYITGQKIVAPSAIACKIMKQQPHALSAAEIEEMVEAFAAAALRIKRSGCDGVEFHMAHGYLICQFLSPYSNKRQDEWGGNPQNRTRFARKIIERTRHKVGPKFPLICRISADEMVEGGLQIEEASLIARYLVEAGADAIHVSACAYESYVYNMPCYYLQDGCFIPLAADIKSVIDVPTIAVGKIRTPFAAEQILQNGQADLIAMGRALIADPYLPQKSRQGNFSQIRPCLSCNQCVESISRYKLECTVNPDIGKETKLEHHHTPLAQKVLVIGGGPAGMEAAKVAAESGHQVILYEAGARLGGKLFSASLPPGKKQFQKLIDYYAHRLAALGVNVIVNSECTTDIIKSEDPDTIILASGAKYSPKHLQNTKGKIMACEQALNNTMDLGNRILIIGGGPRGAEVADFFSIKQKQVTLVEKRKKIGFGLPTGVRYHLEKRLKAANVKLLTGTVVLDISEDRIKVKSKGIEKELSGFDTIILALWEEPNNDLGEELTNLKWPIYIVGDAKEPRGIKDAISEGALAARKI